VKNTLEARIYDRLKIDWLTPSQKRVWEAMQRFDGPPHRVINVYGLEGTGKTFIGWLLERLSYSTYRTWPDTQKPLLSRLTLDDFVADRSTARSIRPLVDTYGIQQIILLSRMRVDEKAMPTFELHVTEEDMEFFRANLYRHLHILLPEEEYRNYKAASEGLP
jgi:hypothetical protein